MGLFRPYQRPESTPEPTPAPAEATAPAKPTRKEAPTPSRREAEAARRERLNPTLSAKEARARERAARAAIRDEQFARSQSSPGKVLLRDFVDSRRGIAQLSMPLLMLTLALSLVVTSLRPDLALGVTFFTYGLFAVIGLDLVLSWFQFKKLAAQRIPGESLRGLVGYLINRSVNLRRLRLPKPRVKPGDPI